MNKIIVVESQKAMLDRLMSGMEKALLYGLAAGAVKRREIEIFKRHAAACVAGTLLEFYGELEEVDKEYIKDVEKRYENNK